MRLLPSALPFGLLALSDLLASQTAYADSLLDEAECSAKDADSCIQPPPTNNGTAGLDEDAATASSSGGCADLRDDCVVRAAQGDCGKFASFMLDECALSCHVCDDYE